MFLEEPTIPIFNASSLGIPIDVFVSATSPMFKTNSKELFCLEPHISKQHQIFPISNKLQLFLDKKEEFLVTYFAL